MKYYVVRTLGCKANVFDSQLIEAELRRQGWQRFRKAVGIDPDAVGLCLINSCTVTDEADRQTRKMAARLGREFPLAQVVVTGCAAEVDPERLLKSAGIRYVVANRDKPRLVHMILEELSKCQGRKAQEGESEILGVAGNYVSMGSRHPMDREWPSVEDFGFPLEDSTRVGEFQKTRAFLKIQEGCNSFCTYCVIPYGRGPSRSLESDKVVAQVQELVSKGYREVVITGTNIGDYGADFGEKDAHNSGIASLLERIILETRIERVRLGSLDPTEMDLRVMDLLKGESRVCAHAHVSLQSPHGRILKLMKRFYGTADVERCLQNLSELRREEGGVFVGMDVITGFPGESREIFEESLTILKGLPWTRLHVFPYSERAGTPATRLGGVVSVAERAERSRILNELSLERMTAEAKGVLATLAMHRKSVARDVLIEGNTRVPQGLAPGKGWHAGHTGNYWRVYVRKDQVSARLNDLISVRLDKVIVNRPAGEVSFSSAENNE